MMNDPMAMMAMMGGAPAGGMYNDPTMMGMGGGDPMMGGGDPMMGGGGDPMMGGGGDPMMGGGGAPMYPRRELQVATKDAVFRLEVRMERHAYADRVAEVLNEAFMPGSKTGAKAFAKLKEEVLKHADVHEWKDQFMIVGGGRTGCRKIKCHPYDPTICQPKPNQTSVTSITYRWRLFSLFVRDEVRSWTTPGGPSSRAAHFGSLSSFSSFGYHARVYIPGTAVRHAELRSAAREGGFLDRRGLYLCGQWETVVRLLDGFRLAWGGRDGGCLRRPSLDFLRRAP